MESAVLDANESLGLRRYRIERDGEAFHLEVHRLPDGGLLEMTVSHLRYIPEGDGEWHEALDSIRRPGEPYFATIDEALVEGHRLIRTWRSDD